MDADVLTSSEFRKRFARLGNPTMVTANGHPIGVWTPVSVAFKETTGRLDVDIQSGRVEAPAGYAPARMTQTERDAILRRVNRS